MELKKIKKVLSKCEITKSTNDTIYVYYPLNLKNEQEGLEELKEYIEFSFPNAEIIRSSIKYIHFYKGEGIRNKSHYKVEVKI